MRKQLKRDIAREERIRNEEAARTEKQFRDVVSEWNRLDKNRERRERGHEYSVYEQMLDWDTFDERVHTNDDHATLMCFCICEMHHLVEDRDISRLINKATDKQKEVFFWRILCRLSTTKIAELLGMTDRNVRKLIDLMVKNIREKLRPALESRPVETLTLEQKKFLEIYIPSNEEERTD
jgi:DNA-directed RNA polymerase specialized sigma24 family protein